MWVLEFKTRCRQDSRADIAQGNMKHCYPTPLSRLDGTILAHSNSVGSASTTVVEWATVYSTCIRNGGGSLPISKLIGFAVR